MFALLCSPGICCSTTVHILPSSCALLGRMCNRHFSSSVLFLTQPAPKKTFHLYCNMRQLSGKTPSQTNQNTFVWQSSLSQLMHQYVNGTSNPLGEVYRCHSLERVLGEHKLHGWTVGTTANVSSWGGWEWIMHVLQKQLPHSGVEGVERVGVGGTFLIKLVFLTKIIICVDSEDTYDEKTMYRYPRGNWLLL